MRWWRDAELRVVKLNGVVVTTFGLVGFDSADSIHRYVYSTVPKDGKRHAYWALVESFRTDAGPRQRVVAWLGKLDEAGRLGVEQAARDTDQSPSNGSATASSRQQSLFDQTFDDAPVEPEWVEINEAGVRVENCG